LLTGLQLGWTSFPPRWLDGRKLHEFLSVSYFDEIRLETLAPYWLIQTSALYLQKIESALLDGRSRPPKLRLQRTGFVSAPSWFDGSRQFQDLLPVPLAAVENNCRRC